MDLSPEKLSHGLQFSFSDSIEDGIRVALWHRSAEFRETMVDILRESERNFGTRFRAGWLSIDALLDPVAHQELAPGGDSFASGGLLSPQTTTSIPASFPATAYVHEYPGKMANLCGPWLGALSEASVRAGGQLLEALIAHARGWGVELVQSILEIDAPQSRQAMTLARMRRLSTLNQMELDLASTSLLKQQRPEPSSSDRWVRFDERDRTRWQEWLASTYEESADCPELNGIRSETSTLDGYFASSGVGKAFVGTEVRELLRAPMWWAQEGAAEIGSPFVSGFLLSPTREDQFELVYLGVRLGERRRGLGKKALVKAIEHAHALGARTIWLAVDSRNDVALSLYEEVGFRTFRTVEAWFAIQ